MHKVIVEIMASFNCCSLWFLSMLLEINNNSSFCFHKQIYRREGNSSLLFQGLETSKNTKQITSFLQKMH